ncbi:hypothetical protein DL93DRAFT_2100751 [Clavulina sp. PMI_390]|nr:hypothetical protein DL93DRAFT_2100751 [Clavulina sp. PMI_390]
MASSKNPFLSPEPTGSSTLSSGSNNSSQYAPPPGPPPGHLSPRPPSASSPSSPRSPAQSTAPSNPFVSPQPTGSSTLSSSARQYAPPPGPPPSHLIVGPGQPSASPRSPARGSAHSDPLVSPQSTGVSHAPPPGPPPTRNEPTSAAISSSLSSPPPSSAAPSIAPIPSRREISSVPSDRNLSEPSNSSSAPAVQVTAAELEMPSEPPPPYSLAPDSWAGEETVQYGPRRPFQPAPPPLRPIPPNASNPSLDSQMSGLSLSPNPTGSGHAPPPRHPSTMLSPSPSSSSSYRRTASFSGPPGAVPGAYPQSGPPPQNSQGPTRYPSNPGPAPSRRRSSDGLQRANTSASAASQQVDPAAQVPDDGKPTKRPVAGHPLLFHGKVLVYPPRYTCGKCLNMGYKNLDVNHACRKCWDKYAKAYEGSPLAYADWTNRSSAETANFQRPISAAMVPKPRPAPTRAAAPSQSQSPPPEVRAGYHPPPPGSLVVMPGDPRIGGQLCWNCNGAGSVMNLFSLFGGGDEECGHKEKILDKAPSNGPHVNRRFQASILFSASSMAHPEADMAMLINE